MIFCSIFDFGVRVEGYHSFSFFFCATFMDGGCCVVGDRFFYLSVYILVNVLVIYCGTFWINFKLIICKMHFF